MSTDDLRGTTQEGRARARRMVRDHMYDRGFENPTEFARAARVSLDTFTDFLYARTDWSHERTLRKIAAVFGWRPMLIDDVAAEVAEEPELVGTQPQRLLGLLSHATPVDYEDTIRFLQERGISEPEQTSES